MSGTVDQALDEGVAKAKPSTTGSKGERDGQQRLAGNAWEQFVAPADSVGFASAWLGLLAERVGQVSAAVVLLEHGGDKVFAPLAVWPEATPELERLGKAIEKTLEDKRGSILDGGAGVCRLAYPLMDDDRVVAVVALEMRGSTAQAQRAFREIHWAGAWIRHLVTGNDRQLAMLARDRLNAVLDHLAILLRHGKFQQAQFELVNSLRHHLGCVRVCLGRVQGHHVKLQAVSDAAEFDRHAPLSKAYEEAMIEGLDAGGMVLAAASAPAKASVEKGEAEQKEPETSGSSSLSRAERVRVQTNAGSVLVFPLRSGVDVEAVLLLESTDRQWTQDQLTWLDAFGALATPVVAARIRSEEGVLRRFQRRTAEVLEKLLGPGHLTWKVVSLGLVALALVLAVPIQYRVTAKTVIEGEVHRVVSAPFDGFLAEAPARPGDVVKAGEVMARLDDKELKLEEGRWSSEADQNANRLREAMANHELPNIAQINAQLAQSRAQLALVRQKLERSDIRAPFDGVVVAGDLSQELGASVEVGKRLYEVAPLDSYRVILQVDERDLTFVDLGQKGTIVMTGMAGDPMAFKVNAITPVATADEGGNFFRVEAKLEGELPRLRPGMEGIGKIETERRSLWWILTHELTDWMRLTFWQWMP